MRSQGKTIICITSLRIVALLLNGGRVAHSTFKINLEINEHSMCSINKNFEFFAILHEASLIIWNQPFCFHIPAAARLAMELLFL
jgi:ATP-dependent DNA helicase PIF1